MTCEHSQTQLTLLADGALPPIQTWHVRRHLAQCRACAAEFAQIVQLGAEACAWRDVAPPTALQSRILAALPPHISRMEKTAMIMERPSPAADSPRLLRTRKARIALALAACLAVALAVTLWPSKQASLPAAYADTVLAMQRVRSVAWTKTDTGYKADGSIEYHIVAQTWVRRDPPAIATLVPLTPENHSITDGYRELDDARGSRRIYLDDGHFKFVKFSDIRKPITEQVQETLDNLMANDATKNNLMKSGSPIIFIHQTPWTQEQAVLNGHVLLRCHKDITVMFLTLLSPAMKSPVVMHRTLWVEPETHRLQRTEWQYTVPKFGGVTSVQDHFVYDQPAPAGVFDDATYSGVRLRVPMAAPSLQGHSHPVATRKP